MKLARSCAPMASVSLFGARLPAGSSAANTRAKISAKATIGSRDSIFSHSTKSWAFKLSRKFARSPMNATPTWRKSLWRGLLAKAVVASIILGASKLSQLEDNLGAIDVKLSDSQIVALDQITAPPSLYPNWFNTNMVDDKHKKYLARIEPSRSDLHASCEGFSIIGIEGIFNRCCQGVCRKWNGMYESSCVVPLKLFGRSYFYWLATILVAHVRTPFAN